MFLKVFDFEVWYFYHLGLLTILSYQQVPNVGLTNLHVLTSCLASLLEKWLSMTVNRVKFVIFNPWKFPGTE